MGHDKAHRGFVPLLFEKIVESINLSKSMRKAAIFGISFIALFLASAFTSAEQETIQWMTWEEAMAKQKVEKRKIIVDIYTDWCVWCKRMEEGTFQKANIAQFINENYYPVKFNAEQRKDIQFKGKTYGFVNQGKNGYHELAAEITRGRLGYPSVVFLDEELEVIQAINGYKDPEEFEMIITYFAGNYHKKVPWEKYTRNYTLMPQAVKD